MSREVEAGISALSTLEECMFDPARPHAPQRSGGPAPRRDRQSGRAQGADSRRGRSLGPDNASTHPGHFARYAIGAIPETTTSLPTHGRQHSRNPWSETRFGVKDERGRIRVLPTRLQGNSGHDVGRFKETPRHAVVSPPHPPSGRLVFPVRNRWKQSRPVLAHHLPTTCRAGTKRSALGADGTEHPEGPPR